MSESEREVLSYAEPRQRVLPADSIGKLVVLALVFAGSHWITEAFTAIQLELVHKVVVPVMTHPDDMDRLRFKVLRDLIIEAEIAIRAAIIVFVGEIIIHFKFRWPLRKWAGLWAILGGVGFCWTRWAIDLTTRYYGIDFPEQADWVVVLALSLFVSVALFRWG